MKNSITKFCQLIDTRHCNSIEIKNDLELWFEHKRLEVKDVKSNILYWLLVNQKSERNFMEQAFEYQFNCKGFTVDCWSRIYLNKCHLIRDKRIGMFNYKILTNSLPSPVQIHKWNRNINKDCEVCKEPDTIAHILYECKVINPIWEKVGNVIKATINYKEIVLGDKIYTCVKYENKDTIIAHIAYYLYTFKMLCKNKKTSFNNNNLYIFIRAKILNVCKMYEGLDQEVYKYMKTIFHFCH